MKFTIKWLQRYLCNAAPASQLISKLNSIGMEVENIIDNIQIYNQFIVAKIIDAEQHPNAEKLRVCQVDDGHKILQIVCGAPNARAGIKVVLAPIGTLIPLNGLIIKKSEIRGVESHGMLCSGAELNLSGDADGILELSDGEVGSSFAEHAELDDIILEIAITPNRGECANVLGIARDLSAAGMGEFMPPIYTAPIFSKLLQNIEIVDTENCFEFFCGAATSVNNTEAWVGPEANLLKNIWYTSKNTLVDVSNFVMFDMGRPNHIYDAEKIVGAIQVRQSEVNEKFIAIGGQAYDLPAGLTVIADEMKVLSVAGVIGGELSKVSPDTTSILIEVADFKAEAVMKAGRALNIITDSRFRFERHIDHNTSSIAMENIRSLIQENCGGAFSEVVKIYNHNIIRPQGIIQFDCAFMKKLTGLELSDEYIIHTLEKLGFIYNNGIVNVPSWRIWDVSSPADLVEEVLRIYGISNVPEIPLDLTTSDLRPLAKTASAIIREKLIARNMDELISWSFTSPEISKCFGHGNEFALSNAMSPALSVMRPSVLCNFIPIIQKNIARGHHNLSFFEIGPVYGPQHPNRQSLMASGVRVGQAIEKSTLSTVRDFDFYDVKDDVLAILAEFGADVTRYHIVREAPYYYHPGRSAAVKLGNVAIAYCGEINPKIIKELQIDTDNIMFFEVLVENIPQSKKSFAKPRLILSEYQAVTRDFAIIIKKEVDAAEIIKKINSLKINILDSMKIFDVYDGKGIEPGYKSVAFTVKLQHMDKTLKDDEIEAIVKQISSKLVDDLGAVVR